MALQVASSEQGAVHLGMKGLHPAVADLREACNLTDIDNFEAGILQHLHRSACRDDFPAKGFELCGEFDNSGLVAY